MDLIKTGAVKTIRSAEEEKEKTWQGYLLAMKEAREYGVTSLQNAGWGDFEAYEKLEKEGELTSRIDIAAPLTGDTTKLKEYLELAKKYPDEGNWIRFGFLKAFADGSIGSSTALMFEPYSDNPGTSGLAMWPYEELEKMVQTTGY
jgi:predicted amidohydrolase YtcJ